jgi:CRP/FNR family transcriptional regulator, cyclic AMP receptor protein
VLSYNCQQLVRPVPARNLATATKPQTWHYPESSPPVTRPAKGRTITLVSTIDEALLPAPTSGLPNIGALPPEIDPLYLFACHVEWEQHEAPEAGWELIAASQSLNSDTRAQALALLASSRHVDESGESAMPELAPQRKQPEAEQPRTEDEMKTPYGLQIVENCAECSLTNPSFFCGFSNPALRALNEVSHKSVLPAGAILYVEGQDPRGLFIICSGRVNLSTTSRDGKILILKTAVAGEALGLSAAISGVPYETTAETATVCQLNFVDRKHFLELMQSQSEAGASAAQCLSRDYQCASRDIHDLVLTRSSAGKLARLLLSQVSKPGTGANAALPMTHEEMAQRIGASRETVTRLLSNLRKKRLIRVEGPTLIIQNRSALEALAV